MPSESLQVSVTRDYIQQLKFTEALKDDEDDDWSFVPEKILMHQLRKTPCWIYKTNDKGNTTLVSTTKRHLRTKLLWKDGTLSWCAADVLRLQNQFVYIPYVCQCPKILHHNDFRWVKLYINQQEGIKKLFKSNRV